MICKNCGTENIDGVRFCYHCGHEIINDGPQAPLDPLPEKAKDKKPGKNPEIQPEKVKEQKPEKNPPEAGAPQPKSTGVEGSNASGTTVASGGMTAGSKTGGNNSALIIVGVLAAVIALALAGGVVFFVLSQITVPRPADDFPQSSAVIDSTEEITGKPAEEETTKPVKEYENIIDKTSVLSDSDLEDLQKRLEKKSEKTGLTVKILVDDSYSGSISSYAGSARAEYISDKDALMIVIDDSSDDMAIGYNGKGDDFTPQELVNKMTEKVCAELSYSDVYTACKIAVDMIPDSIGDAKLYNYERVDGADQVVYVDSDKNTVTLIDWSGDKPKKLFSTDTVYFGKDGLTNSPSESKAATPKGTFRLGFAFSDHSLDTGLDFELIKPNMVWVDDPDSDYYNMLMEITNYSSVPPASNPGKWDSSEQIYNIFDGNGGDRSACILIEHNGDGYSKGTSGKGSAIFISGKVRNLSSSWGDVNISSSDMTKLLSKLEESKDPHIIIK